MSDYELGLLDQQLLLAILRQRPNAYGVSMQDHIKEHTGRTPSIGSVYVAIERLEEAGYVKPRRGEITNARGGRAKTYFDITARGQHALTAALQASDNLRAAAGLVGALA